MTFPTCDPVLQGAKGMFLTLIKILPLALYLRSAACKFEIPVLGCETELCPVAIGKPGDCQPTGARPTHVGRKLTLCHVVTFILC